MIDYKNNLYIEMIDDEITLREYIEELEKYNGFDKANLDNMNNDEIGEYLQDLEWYASK